MKPKQIRSTDDAGLQTPSTKSDVSLMSSLAVMRELSAHRDIVEERLRFAPLDMYSRGGMVSDRDVLIPYQPNYCGQTNYDTSSCVLQICSSEMSHSDAESHDERANGSLDLKTQSSPEILVENEDNAFRANASSAGSRTKLQDNNISKELKTRDIGPLDVYLSTNRLPSKTEVFIPYSDETRSRINLQDNNITNNLVARDIARLDVYPSTTALPYITDVGIPHSGEASNENQPQYDIVSNDIGPLDVPPPIDLLNSQISNLL